MGGRGCTLTTVTRAEVDAVAAEIERQSARIARGDYHTAALAVVEAHRAAVVEAICSPPEAAPEPIEGDDTPDTRPVRSRGGKR